MRRVLPVALLFVLTVMPYGAHAEWYVGGQVGWNAPNDFENPESSSGVVTFRTNDLTLESSPLYGGKVGYFLSSLPWLGFEAEAFTTTPNFERQVFRPRASGFETLSQQRQADMRVTTVALNLILRVPGRRFEPYIGGGPALYWARFSSNDVDPTGRPVGSSTDTSWGLNFLAGARYFLFKRLALFGEYKYNAASLDFGDNVLLKGDYSAHNLVGGLTVHFR